MVKTVETMRKGTRFLLATFLWTHAFFLLNIHSQLVTALRGRFSFTAAEATLILLLVTLSFISGSGFLEAVKNLAYIYFFPFVALFYLFYWPIRFAIRRKAKPTDAIDIQQKSKPTMPLTFTAPISEAEKEKTAEWVSIGKVITRPFRKFTFIWCLLVAFAAHRYILIVATAVLLLQLTRKIHAVVVLTWSSKTAIEKAIERMIAYFTESIDALSGADVAGTPVRDLRNLINKLKGIEFLFRFIANTAAFWLSTMIAAATVLVLTYVYFAVLFAFAYIGVSRIVGMPLTLGDAIVTSLFIPFYASDLPKSPFVRILGGVHCVLVLTLGVGAAMNYFRRQLEPLQNTVAVLQVRLADENLRERYLVIQEKIKSVDETKKEGGSSPS